MIHSHNNNKTRKETKCAKVGIELLGTTKQYRVLGRCSMFGQCSVLSVMFDNYVFGVGVLCALCSVLYALSEALCIVSSVLLYGGS
jgi:hypothetical protein